jgi:hypothetical protein
MSRELHNDRIINGLLKAEIGLVDPVEIQTRLTQDVLLIVAAGRATLHDLWPCIWFLASILEREFTGHVFIKCDLVAPLQSPAPFSGRCQFVSADFIFNGLTVALGADLLPASAVWGDARGSTISYGCSVDGDQPASPLACCALAGYLGFAVLATAVGIPGFHETWKMPSLTLRTASGSPQLPKELVVLGTGQIGQAFLSLAFFVYGNNPPLLHLVDRDICEPPNYRSQLLLSEPSERWDGRPKVDVIADLCHLWSWTVTRERTNISWGWVNPLGQEAIAFLGFDNMESRRVGVEAGFGRLVECGVGTDFLQPRVSWHSLPPDRELAMQFFNERPRATREAVASEFLAKLNETPGQCGRVTFENIDASAPCLGALGAAFAWAELLNFCAGDVSAISGGAYAWSPLQPIQREVFETI